MSDKSNIAWTDATLNPVRGCSRCSPGCEHCYAERMAGRFSGKGYWGHGFATRNSKGQGRWTGKVAIVPEKLLEPFRWRRPRRVFVNSTSDLFHERLSNEDIAAVFGMMAACRQHTFQVLTKRSSRMPRWFEWTEAEGGATGPMHVEFMSWLIGQERLAGKDLDPDDAIGEAICDADWPLPNVWLGVSAEDQKRADERLPRLLQCPAAVRFLSAEPLLGPVDVIRAEACAPPCGPPIMHVDWVIVGCESGPGARPMDLDWVRSIRDQCIKAGVPFFFKQAVVRGHLVETPELDGRIWEQFPRCFQNGNMCDQVQRDVAESATCGGPIDRDGDDRADT